GSAIVGRVPRGTVFEVTRNLGSWVKVPWPASSDGVGYVHVSWGQISEGAPAPSTRVSEATPRISPEPVRATAVANVERATENTPVSQMRLYVVPPSHLLGLGMRFGGSMHGYGATARAWSTPRLGLQLDVAHADVTDVAGVARVQTTGIAPTVLYSPMN